MVRVVLGDQVKDRITGFAGVAVAKIEYLNGCKRISIQPKKLHEGKVVESEWIDIEQIIIVKPLEPLRSKPTGGSGRSVPSVRREEKKS